MSVAFLSPSLIDTKASLSGMVPALERALAAEDDVVVVRPEPVSLRSGSRSGVPHWLQSARAIRKADTVFWVQYSARPETAIWALAYARPWVRKAAWIVDPWRPNLAKIARVATAQRMYALFTPFREACLTLAPRLPGRVFWTPYAADPDVFNTEVSADRPIAVYLMGRGHEAMAAALEAYCHDRGLTYRRTRGGEIADPRDLGRITGQAQYFVTTPPDLDNRSRTGGFSPLVMRYFEGLAAGARLIGTLPNLAEFDALLPRSSLLELAPDGSDVAAKLDVDLADPQRQAATVAARDLVLLNHTWPKRIEFLLSVLRSDGAPPRWDAVLDRFSMATDHAVGASSSADGR